jgi:hypothetical protein
MQDLVPCVLLSFDKEQILMYRGKEWKSRYPKPLTLIPKVPNKNLEMTSDVSLSGMCMKPPNYFLDLVALIPRSF